MLTRLRTKIAAAVRPLDRTTATNVDTSTSSTNGSTNDVPTVSLAELAASRAETLADLGPHPLGRWAELYEQLSDRGGITYEPTPKLTCTRCARTHTGLFETEECNHCVDEARVRAVANTGPSAVRSAARRVAWAAHRALAHRRK